jgi:hypothetical protein
LGQAQALVAQRIRASDYGSEGREFESLQARLTQAVPRDGFLLAGSQALPEPLRFLTIGANVPS